MNWQQQAQECLLENRYDQVASLYEQAITVEPEVFTHHWHLGLAYLLQNQEEAAQVTWLMAMAQGTDEKAEQWAEELVQILDTEAQRQAALEKLQASWLIRQHIREIAPTFIDNLFHLIQLAIDLSEFTPERLDDWQVAASLQQTPPEKVDLNLVLQVLKKLLEFPTPETLPFVEACILHQTQNSGVLLDTLMPAAVKLAHQIHRPDVAANIAELCLKLKPEHPEPLRHLAGFYTNAGLHQQAIETAKTFFDNCIDTLWQVQGSYVVLRSLLSAGSWLEVEPVAMRHKSLVMDLVQNPPPPEDLLPGVASYLIPANFSLPYFEDEPQENRWLQNQIAQLFQKTLQAHNPELVQSPRGNQWKATRPLKIGYIAHTLRDHSVGWLSRWLFQYYDRESFQTNLYLIYQNSEDHQWFREQVDCVQNFDAEPQTIASKIKENKIDILVDLDSITMDITCQVMALKPAPVQVTWLGWDASGIPAIDYFLADPHVLPENAQDYYSETIWRLPQTYVAVDGFEVGVPTLRREHLDIPADAVIYLSAQHGFKRHPDTVRLQMQILQQVPNSYFLVKGRGDDKVIQQFFTQIAESEGVDPERLKFLPRDPSVYVHRANLGIADVVLDTYPYNGATTTLETLWMGIPLVTRVGQQFAARNSYTFMMNVGVTEGIAWTNEEYVEWGIRLGKDPVLRQQIAWRLRQSRQTSPLWNAQQFTREMEKAYKQMWQKYVEAECRCTTNSRGM